MQALEPRAGEELERVIGRYARVRLDPSPAQTRRARAAVMEQAWRQHLGVAGASPSKAPARRRRGPFTAWGVRRASGALVAAVVAGLMIGSTTFAASRAGGPLYDARLGLETLTLPNDPAARLEAELARAQTRVAEIGGAAARGDNGALNAAVAAYGAELTALDAADGAPAGRALDAVRLHQAVLLDLLNRVPSQAMGGIETALASSSSAIDHLDGASGREPGTGGNPNPGAGNPNPGAGNPNAGGGNPDPGAGNPTTGGGQPNPGGGAGTGGGTGTGGGNAGGDAGSGGGAGSGDNSNAGGGKPDRTPKPDRPSKPGKAEQTPHPTPRPTD